MAETVFECSIRYGQGPYGIYSQHFHCDHSSPPQLRYRDLEVAFNFHLYSATRRALL